MGGTERYGRRLKIKKAEKNKNKESLNNKYEYTRTVIPDNTTEEAESNNSAKPAGKPDEPQADVSDTCVSSIEEEDETTVKTDPIEPESDEEDEENEKTLPIEEEGEESS